MTAEVQPKLEPVRKELVVRCRQGLAFDVFTTRMSEWWPLASHSIGQDRARSVTIEPRVGGRLYETCDDGSEHDWGEVTHWDPPAGFDCTWHPGGEPNQATRLSLRFEAEGEGTRVRLEHRGWEILGDRAAETRAGYDSGWESVFVELYQQAADAAASITIASATRGEP